MTRGAVAAVAAAAVACGCGADAAAPPAAGVRVKPGCERVVPPKVGAPAPGLIKPRARIVQGAIRPPGTDPQITIVSGYIELEPPQLRSRFANVPGLTIVYDENETFDAEVLVSDGTYRNFWKAVKRCPGGSSFTTTIAPESALRD